MDTNCHPAEYVAIALWGERLGSFPYYIKAQQARASAEGAPLDALYKAHNHDGSESSTWVCVSHLTSKHPVRALYEQAFATA